MSVGRLVRANSRLNVGSGAVQYNPCFDDVPPAGNVLIQRLSAAADPGKNAMDKLGGHFPLRLEASLLLGVMAAAACDPSCKPNNAKRAEQCEELGRAKTWQDWDNAIGCTVARPATVCAPHLVCSGTLAISESGSGETMFVGFVGNHPVDGGWVVWLGVVHKPESDREGNSTCDVQRLAMGCEQVCDVEVDPQTGEVLSAEYFDDSNLAERRQKSSTYLSDGGPRRIDDRATLCTEWK